MQIVNSPIYVIKDGDSLSSIAEKFNVNPTSILLVNNITPKNIRKGFVLYIPSQNS